MTKIFYTLLFLLLVNYADAQQDKIDLTKLTNQTQQFQQTENDMNFCWWLPIEYWIASAQSTGNQSISDAVFIQQVLSNYEIFAFLKGDVSDIATVTYKPKTYFENSIEIKNENGELLQYVKEDEMSAESQTILFLLKPLLQNLLGEMGNNLHFFAFKAYNSAGKRILDPKKEGNFRVKTVDNEYLFRLPLGALLPPKTCPIDNEEFDGSWKYCPYHGNELILND